jgi:hypothetical protein
MRHALIFSESYSDVRSLRKNKVLLLKVNIALSSVD